MWMNLMCFLQSASTGDLPSFAPPGHLSVVGVEDVARGILASLARGRAGERYLLCGENWTHEQLFRAAAELFGQALSKGTLPAFLWRTARALVSVVDRVRPMELVTPQMMAHLGSSYRFDASKAERELGLSFQPAREVLASAKASLAKLTSE